MGLGRFFRRRFWDEERAREIESYLEIETAENISRGMTPEQARYAACKKFGNAAQVREEIYRMNTIGFLESLGQDLRYAARLLRLNPGFAVVAILSLALGIGANTAIFQLLNALRLRTLPVKNPQELADVHIIDMKGARGTFYRRHPAVTNPIWEQIRSQPAFSGVLAWTDISFDLATSGESRPARGLEVSGDFFRVLGVEPFLGRVFTAADDQRGCGSPGAVISLSFWQREFGGDMSVVGRKLTLDNHPFEIIGVTPASFFGLEVGRSFDVAVPICAEAILWSEDKRLDSGTEWWLTVLGRLKPGTSLEQATAQLGSLSPAIFEQTLPADYPPESAKLYQQFKLAAFPAGSGLSGLRVRYSNSLLLLLAIAGLTLLIACANLANLMLARASARGREIAVRQALGAWRGRLIRQFMVESLLLAATGGVLGFFVAGALSRFLVAFLSSTGEPLFLDLTQDYRVLLFTAGMAVLTCMLFGLTPAIRGSRSAPGIVMKSNGRGTSAGRERFGLRRALVVSQVAFSLVLLVGALLFSRSLSNLLALDAGFQQSGILVAEVDLSRLNLAGERSTSFRQEMLERVRAIPSVDAVASTRIVPLTGNGWDNDVRAETAPLAEAMSSNVNFVSPSFFNLLGTKLLKGRDFDARDRASSAKVAIVNETFARRVLHAEDPVGKRFWLGEAPANPETLYEIIGLVKDTKYRDLREDFTPITFFAASQAFSPGRSDRILIRSGASLDSLTASVRDALDEIDPNIRFQFQVLESTVEKQVTRERLMAMLSNFFGMLAVLLATIGLYGVISYGVAQRKNEIGIRLALGADRRSITAMILREAGVLLAAGLGAGALLSLFIVKAAAALLFGVQPDDPAILATAALSLAVVAVGASYLPARRAGKPDPMLTLKSE